MGSISIAIANGQLGQTLQTNDGIMGMVLTGVSESGGYTLGNPIVITGMASLAAAGISQANNPFAYRQVQEYYNEVGDGATLYLMLVANTMTVAQMFDNTNASGVKKLWLYSQGKIKVMGGMTDDKTIAAVPISITVTNSLNALVYTAAANAKVFAAACAAAQQPLRCVVGGTSYNGTASGLVDETSGTSNNMAQILIGDTQSYDATYSSAALGMYLGRLSSIPVQRKASRVKDGPLTAQAIYLHTTAIESAGSDPTTIANKGYVSFRTWPNLSGYFFSGDPMLTVTTDDYAVMGRCRVIDKVQRLAYAIFVQEVDDEVPVNGDGTIDAGFAKYLQNQMINQLEQVMVNNGEISKNPSCYIDPSQNILSTNQLNVVVKVIPEGYSDTIVINLGLSNPAL